MIKITLKPGRSAPFSNRHPWLFSGAIAKESSLAKAGDWVKVVDDKDVFIAYGLYNPHSQIRIRLYAFEQDNVPHTSFWDDKIKQSIELREHILGFTPSSDSAYRIINSEGDGLSGLTIDRYGEYLAVQFTSLALYMHKDAIISSLITYAKPKGIIIRTEADMLAEEKLELKDGIVYGNMPQSPIIIKENGVLFEINLSTGQKTGFYLDQRANRVYLQSFVKGKTVLDLCTYSGGFALHSAKAGAKAVTAVDVSANALELAKQNAALNGFTNIEFVKADMFKYLENCVEKGIIYDTIILDPPKMTHSKGSLSSALSGYLKLNAMALKCLSTQGILVTCSCSGRVSRDDFLNLLHRAAMINNSSLRILGVRGADIDHPVSTSCPESEYLKCVVCYAK
jgi:23S rRNA (cytosine1962-C5)-methyltransferase